MGENFKISEDGTIERFNVKNKSNSSLDNEILEIIDIHSYASSKHSAYKARKISIALCRKYKDITYPKEYVERLMQKNYPAEYEKARVSINIKRVNKTFASISTIAIITFVAVTYPNYKDFMLDYPTWPYDNYWDYVLGYDSIWSIIVVLLLFIGIIWGVVLLSLSSKIKLIYNK